MLSGGGSLGGLGSLELLVLLFGLRAVGGGEWGEGGPGHDFGGVGRRSVALDENVGFGKVVNVALGGVGHFKVAVLDFFYPRVGRHLGGCL